MPRPDYRPVRSFSLGLLITGVVLLCASLLLMVSGLAFSAKPVWILLIVGAVVFLAGVLCDLRGIRFVFSNRQAGLGFLSLVAVLLAVIILILVSYVASRHSTKFDWTDKHLWTLSPEVKDRLVKLDRPITATILFVPRYGNSEMDEENADITKRILQQFADASPNFSCEFIDLAGSPETWKLVQGKFNVTERDVPCIIFTSGDRKEVVSFDSIYSVEPAPGGQRPMESYKGEARFASAIMTLTGTVMPRVYFTTGHGEATLERELADVADQLRSNYLEAKPCPDLTRQPVPDDAAALLIIGPTRPFSAEESRRIADYVQNRKGSLYVGVDAGVKTGLDDLLAGFGIVLDNDVVVDESSGHKSLTVRAIPQTYHETTRDLQNVRISFDAVRSIEILPMSPEPATGRNLAPADPILTTSRTVYGETDIQKLMDERVTQYDPSQDIRRPNGLALAVAWEKAPAPSPYAPPPPSEEGHKTRVVVVGSAYHMLAGNLFGFTVEPSYGNVSFFMNCVKWLAQTTEPIKLPPLDLDRRPLDKLAGDQETQAGIFWVLVIALPSALLVAGGIVWLFRRS